MFGILTRGIVVYAKQVPVWVAASPINSTARPVLLLQSLPAREVGCAFAFLNEVPARKVRRADEGDDLFPLPMRVVVLELSPRAPEGGCFGKGLVGVRSEGHAGEMDDAVALVDVLDEEVAQGAGRCAEALLLREDAEMRAGEGSVEDVAQRFEIVAGGAQEDGGSTHAREGVTGGGGGGKRGCGLR